MGSGILKESFNGVAAEDDLLEDRANQGLAFRKAHRLEPLREDGRERVDALKKLVALACALMLLLERLELLLERLDSSRHRRRAILEFLLLEEAALIGGAGHATWTIPSSGWPSEQAAADRPVRPYGQHANPKFLRLGVGKSLSAWGL